MNTPGNTSQDTTIRTLEYAITCCQTLDPRSKYGRLLRQKVEDLQGEPRERLMAILQQREVV